MSSPPDTTRTPQGAGIRLPPLGMGIPAPILKTTPRCSICEVPTHYHNGLCKLCYNMGLRGRLGPSVLAVDFTNYFRAMISLLEKSGNRDMIQYMEHLETLLYKFNGWDKAVSEWATARVTDVFEREHSTSLRVGPDKPLGSQGYPGLVGALKGFWDNWNDLKGHTVKVWPGVGGSLWIYAWDEVALQELLEENGELLVREDWPTEPLAFVDRMRDKQVRPCTPLYNLIADAHADTLNPGRTDVLPGVPRRLLMAATNMMGPDPAVAYFLTFPDALDDVPVDKESADAR